MACLLKAPAGDGRGCVVFTTQERDNVISNSAQTRALLESLKPRYLVGLHHNWHDHEFRYDPLFDFSMAGDGDLIEVDGRPFPRIPLDACNFAPRTFFADRSAEKFWDVLYVARAVFFKNLPGFFAAIRSLYDRGTQSRVLVLCPTPEPIDLPGVPDLRAHFESVFSAEERKRVTLLTIDWDYPFPLDLETLAFFYRHSRIFFHAAPQERRCRTAAYAWASGMPVVASESVASILPQRFHRPPFLYCFDAESEMPAAVARALEKDSASSEWRNVATCFAGDASAARVDADLADIAKTLGRGETSDIPINARQLDIRLGRHHQLAMGGNRIDMSIDDFCRILRDEPDVVVQQHAAEDDPEMAIARRFASAAPATAQPSAPGAPDERGDKPSGIFSRRFWQGLRDAL